MIPQSQAAGRRRRKPAFGAVRILGGAVFFPVTPGNCSRKSRRMRLRVLNRDTRQQGGKMANTDSRVTIHMAASLDGFIARKDGGVEWLETTDEFAAGDTMEPGFVEGFLKTIDCYVMGSRTYETALNFEAKGFGWSYGDKPLLSSPVAICREREIPWSRISAELSGEFVVISQEPRAKHSLADSHSAPSAEIGAGDGNRTQIVPRLIR